MLCGAATRRPTIELLTRVHCSSFRQWSQASQICARGCSTAVSPTHDGVDVRSRLSAIAPWNIGVLPARAGCGATHPQQLGPRQGRQLRGDGAAGQEDALGRDCGLHSALQHRACRVLQLQLEATRRHGVVTRARVATRRGGTRVQRASRRPRNCADVSTRQRLRQERRRSGRCNHVACVAPSRVAASPVSAEWLPGVTMRSPRPATECSRHGSSGAGRRRHAA